MAEPPQLTNDQLFAEPGGAAFVQPAERFTASDVCQGTDNRC